MLSHPAGRRIRRDPVLAETSSVQVKRVEVDCRVPGGVVVVVDHFGPILAALLHRLRGPKLDRTLIWNQSHLLHALREFEAFFNERSGLGNKRIQFPGTAHLLREGEARPLWGSKTSVMVGDLRYCRTIILAVRQDQRLCGLVHASEAVWTPLLGPRPPTGGVPGYALRVAGQARLTDSGSRGGRRMSGRASDTAGGFSGSGNGDEPGTGY